MDQKGSPLALPYKLKFWYQHFVKGEDSFEESLRPVAVLTTVEDFWAYYQHFKRPTDLPVGSYIYLFQENVKPVWEDDFNRNGGAFVLRFEKPKCDRLWEDILLGFIAAKPGVYTEVNGLRLKVKKDFAEIDFWIRHVDDEILLERCRKWIVGVTGL
ncbi:unnamed protein product [Sphagnum balticum]